MISYLRSLRNNDSLFYCFRRINLNILLGRIHTYFVKQHEAHNIENNTTALI